MKKLLFLFAGAVFFLFSCTTTRITSIWKDPQLTTTNYKNIIVVCLMDGVKNKSIGIYLERHICEDLQQMGYSAKSSIDIYGPKRFQGKTDDEVINMVRTDGYDAVITIAVLDVMKEQNYVRGNAEFWPGGIYYSRFGRYYFYWQNRVYTPGYYVSTTTYIIEGNLFDVGTDKLVFSAQTETIDPGTLDNLGHRFSMRLLKAMKEKEIFR